jgi:queuosine precursor transporter
MSVEPQAAGAFPRAEATYTFLAALFVVVLVLTNIIGTKLFVLFPDGGPAFILGGEPWVLTTGILTYPITFFLTDIVSELWGRRRANFMVIAGFVMSLLMLGILQMAIAMPPAPFWTVPSFGFDTPEDMQRAFHATFNSPGILLFASMSAYLVAQLFDVHLYHFWWRLTKGRHMWLRNNGSTMISQFVDTVIVVGIFLRWGLGNEWAQVFQVIVAVYLCKVMLALIDTPLIYLGCRLFERFLGIEPDPDRTSAPLA